jgi:hypothetical protein
LDRLKIIRVVAEYVITPNAIQNNEFLDISTSFLATEYIAIAEKIDSSVNASSKFTEFNLSKLPLVNENSIIRVLTGTEIKNIAFDIPLSRI